MSNQQHISNLMAIHRDFAHMVTEETKHYFDATIAAAIIALNNSEEINEIDMERLKEDEMPEVYKGST